ncbi:longitudinals lacking protein, isoforms N/O/W/X/Y isoform X1 [Drosophila pseudoobscura]|uniref:Longitudinals lacking protein, isoforms N/O/W/X/Y isoform X1 n=1 Tax=Drosophila pseudoobscura pseudoobscura TaxID=46245 RepID=A0A6I8W3N1_DROPS|nr:longitudinals lacking protein, isoforms N/O/W/X/Y isoform X1 [Drosophila pseudoobscura]XP_015043794.2 longitudinals lacking protein, isoforms N/O/W/X/Y isoform X1 [Drosophila pseudoobscura]XP_033237946.1 longitudinals lacking protein, isoforms N/O/W/X/Y isoform X1 [Drosophila pseudoobscura]XP_033237947.1 longitudinals lacking protein, isoforms N/O/W/X/Y isoform X1 [Drosophila pseudoobscura]XP_033237948.1 longitudinals lacking protein, isoforms N/O/W/X/Y isoform X1 [Drosophila pseudoobscura]
MSVQQFCLRWNNHQPNFISVCSSLLHNGTLVDVTLAAEGRQLQAHKIVLSACSSYFQALFTTNPCQHPIVILKDVQYDDLKTMVDFMYYGEVNVSQEQLPHILKTAEMLKIKGLAEMPTDPANLTKSDSKSSSDGTELVGGAGSGVAGAGGTSAGSLGAASGSSVGDSLWSSSEAQQFQQQQQQQQQAQQQQQHHHHQQQQQHQLQQQQQQQQQAQQQQQQHHHHHHQHQQQQQQQQQGGQTQAPQTHHHQMRRTPSPLSAGTSPATRRKRLRKSSNNGSGERNNAEEQHNSSLDAGSAAGNAGLSLAQMSQMSFGGAANTAAALGSLASHSLHASKLLKESASSELDQQPQDSDLDDGHGHLHMQIKPEVDIGGVNQTMPLDISGATTPSEHDAPNSQSSHSEPSPAHAPHHPHPPLVATSSSSGGSGSFERSFSIGGLGETDPENNASSPVMMGTKRNRVLTRQPRVKRDSDSISSTNQISPETAATTLDFDPFNAAGATSATARDYSTTGSHHLHHQHSHPNPHQQQHHHHQAPPQHHHLLTVPPRIERHASEPAPSLGPSTPHLLSVPSSTPYLIKQHSDPLLPRQSALHSATGNLAGGTNPFAPLHRQYSHPLSGSNAGYVPPTPLHHPHHISLPESIYASGSPPPAGSSQYLVPTRVVACPVSSETAATPTNASSNVSSSTVSAVSVVTSPTAGLNSSRHSFSPTYAGSSETAPPERRSPHSHSHSPTVTHSHSLVERSSKGSDAANGSGGSKLRNSKSVTGTGSTSHLHPGQTTMSSSAEHLPTLRVKNEELQRSVSSPQTQREIITLENPRSSHCPVIRPGPALGCNFCWNTIDGHGRILRRKTKYHCPECQTNLCIVPCFQEYHERLNNEAAATVGASGSASASASNSSAHDNQLHSSSTGSSSGSGKASPYVSAGSSNSGSGTGPGPGAGTGAARHYTKTESI